MKHKNYVLFSLFFLLSIFTTMAQTSNEYEATEASSLVTDIEAGTYNVYVLSSSGGVYDLSDIDLSSDITVKAKEGLAAMPVISKADNTSTYKYFFDIEGAYSLTVEGIKFDGTATEAISGVVRARGDNATVNLTNCEMQNFSTSNGIARLGNAGVSLTVNGCFMHDAKGRLLRVDNSDAVMGDISIENSTFANVTNESVLHWVSTGSSTVNNITVNQCTFYNIASEALKLGTVVNQLAISNCIFDEVTGGVSIATAGSSSTMDYCYSAGLASGVDEDITLSNEITTAPVYTDAANLDLTLTNANQILGSAGTAIGDARWIPVVVENSNEYTVDDLSALTSDMEAGTYDVYILSTSGGTYDLSDIDLSSDIKVRAKGGLAEMPMISKTGNTSTYKYFFDIEGAYSLTVEGIKFDGTATEAISGVVRARGDNATVNLINCEMQNFSTSNGIARLGNAGVSLTVNGCFMHDAKGRLLRVDNSDAVMGDISIENSTFANVTNESVLHWVSTGSSTVNNITINQCTFYNIASEALKLGTIVNQLAISNCIFDEVTGGVSIATAGSSSTMDYCYSAGLASGVDEDITLSNEVTTAPIYTDAANLDLTLSNANLILGSAGITIGDPRWFEVSDDVIVTYEAQTVSNAADQNIVAKSNKEAGFIYIILDGETQSTLVEMEAAIAANKGAKAAVSAANTDVLVSTNALVAGTYFGYAVDGGNNISEKGSNEITILEANIPVAVSNEVQVVSNAKDQVALVQSNKPAGAVYMVLDGEAQATLAEIHAAIAANKADSATVTANDVDMSIATDSLMLGTYYAYAADVEGNLSPKGNNAITVVKGAPEVYAEAQTSSDADEMFVTVQSSDSEGFVYIILDGIAQDSIPEFEAAVAAGQGAKGIVTAALTDVQLSTTDLTVGVYYAYATDAVGNVSAKGSNKITVLSSTAPYKEYTVEELGQFEEDVEAGLYELYILSTSGGIYDVSSAPDVSKSATIIAKPGLAEKPILKFSANTTSYTGIFRIRYAEEPVELTFQGLEFDTEGNPGNVLRVDSETKLTFIDCYLHGNTNSNGSIRLGAEGSSVSMENCLVSNCNQRFINLYTNTATFGDIVLKNSTFTKLSGEGIVYYRSSGGAYAGGTSLTVDHCTFSEIGGDIFRYDKTLIPEGISVTNSIFDQVGDSLNVDVLDYNYLDVELLADDAGTNTFTTPPVFTDSANYNYGLANNTEYVCGDGNTVGDLTWYVEAETLFAIMYPQKSTNLEGDFVKAQANVGEGTLYIIREDMPATSLEELDIAVASNKGQSATIVAANTEVNLSVTGLYSGNYYAYVVVDGAISSPSQYAATVLDWLNIQYEEQTVTNGVGKTITVVTSVDGVAYLVKEGDYETVEDLEFAVNGGRGVKADAIGEDETVLSVEGIQIGTYFGYAVSGTDVSLRGENPVFINTAIFVDCKTQTATNIEGAWSYAFYQGGSVGSWAYLLNDSVPFETLTPEILEEAVGNNLAVKDSVVLAEQDAKISTVGLEPGSYHFYLVLGDQVSDQGEALVKVRQPKRYYYSEEQAEEMRLAFYNSVITTGDEVILTTSGGMYNMKTYFRIFGGVTLRAQEGLAEKPVIMYNPIAGGEDVRYFMPLVEFYPPGGQLNFKGIEFNGGANDGLPGDATFGTRVREDATFNYGYSIVYDDCYFHDFNTINVNSSGVSSQDGYVFRQANNTFADSVIFNNCIVENTFKPAVYFRNVLNKEYFNRLKIENSTFSMVPTALQLDAAVDGALNNIYMNHCTFDSIGTDTSVSRLILPDNLPNLNISNSLFTNSTSQVESDTAIVLAETGILLNCNFFNTAMVVLQQSQVSNTTYLDPAYYNRNDFNFAITESALLNSASDGKQVGDLRWESINNFKVNPDMLYVNSTTLRLSFNQPMDTVAAKVATNYAISGTAGLSGTPEQVSVVAYNAVEIVVGDFSQAIDFSTVIVTVSNVTNVNTNTLVGGNNMAIYTSPIAVTMEEQLVANEDGQFVEATCGSDNSTIYLVPEEAIIFSVTDLIILEAEGLARKAMVETSMQNALIDVDDLTPGNYYAYAVNEMGEEWSARSANKATVKGFEVIMPIQLGKTNGEGETVITQSTFMNASVYLILDSYMVESVDDLESAVAENTARKAEVVDPFTDLLIEVEGIRAGTYRAYAAWGDSISTKSGVTVQINQFVGVGSHVASEINVFAYQNKAIVQMAAEEKAKVAIYSASGALVRFVNINATRTEIALETGMYIIKVITPKGYITQKLMIE